MRCREWVKKSNHLYTQMHFCCKEHGSRTKERIATRKSARCKQYQACYREYCTLREIMC